MLCITIKNELLYYYLYSAISEEEKVVLREKLIANFNEPVSQVCLSQM